MERIPSGTNTGGPLKSMIRSAQQGTDVTSRVRGSHYRAWYERFDEFDGATLSSPWATRIAGTTPTMAKVANEVNGVWRATLASTSEAETAGADFGDSLMLSQPSAGRTHVNTLNVPVFEAYVRIPTALTTAQTVVIGLATAFNATLTSISKYVWFRFNANMNVLLESKDGTNTNTAQAPTAGTLTLTANQFYLFSIDWVDPANVRMFVDDNLVGTLNMGALAATDKFQPSCYLQKASGVSVPTLDIDWAMISSVRPDF
jgi:hypothetical protein